MNTIRRLTSSTLVLAAASLTACADAAPTALQSSPADQAVAAANANVGTSGSVIKIGSASRSLARAVALTTLNPTDKDFQEPNTGAVITTQCPAYMPAEDGEPETSAAYNCFDPYYPEPTPPTPTVTAGFSFGSDATAISILPGTTLKTLTLSSFSQALSNVSFTTLDASFRNVGAQTSCYNTAGQFDSSHASGAASPLYLSASRNPAWQGVIRWQVNGTHGFSPVSGATGGGTFYSSDFTCG